LFESREAGTKGAHPPFITKKGREIKSNSLVSVGMKTYFEWGTGEIVPPEADRERFLL